MNYQVKERGEVIKFVGNYAASKGQAAALVLYVFFGEPVPSHREGPLSTLSLGCHAQHYDPLQVPRCSCSQTIGAKVSKCCVALLQALAAQH